MRLITYRHEGMDSVGALLGSRVVCLSRAYAGYLHSQGVPSPYPLAAAGLPGDMLLFLSAGEGALSAARQAIDFVEERAAAGGDPRGPLGEHLLLPLDEVTLLAPIPRPGKLLCIGLNYRDHAAEVQMKLPERPLLFAKYSSAVMGPGVAIEIPPISDQIDYEVELAVVIGKKAKGVAEDQALEYVAGYTVMNDVTARDIQFGDGQWVRGKSFDTFAPLGPALVTRDEVPNPDELDISLRLNGRVMQKSNTRNLVFGVRRLVSFLSEAITLEPGDVIATGTPAGVGYNHKPPVYLKPGDVVVCDVEKVGVLENPVAGG